jgi:hypothetical protein
MKVKIKSLKVDLTKVTFKDPKKVNDGTNGKILEQAMIEQGFPIDQTGTVDLASIETEVKSRSATTNAMHTQGTMTYNNIINTPWNKTKFKQKLQQQYQVSIKSENNATGNMEDFTDSEIQNTFEADYENCRRKLIKQGGIIKGQTISGGDYMVLEHKPGPNGTGKSYACRIRHAGMKKIWGLTNVLRNPLFERVKAS